MRIQKGISTIGVVLAVIIIAVIAIILLPQVWNPQKSQIADANQEIQTIMTALQSYKSDNGFYPSEDQGLRALIHPPDNPPVPYNWNDAGYLKQIPLDPWGNEYQYENDNGQIRVYSYGSGGKAGNTVIQSTGN